MEEIQIEGQLFDIYDIGNGLNRQTKIVLDAGEGPSHNEIWSFMHHRHGMSVEITIKVKPLNTE